jgi:hypothetical protein
MELTKLENKLMERAIKKYQSPMYRKSQLLGWIGVAFFSIGLMRTFSWSSSLLPGWCYRLFLGAGFMIIFWSQYALAVTVIGKLAAQIQKLERQSGRHTDGKT